MRRLRHFFLIPAALPCCTDTVAAEPRALSPLALANATAAPARNLQCVNSDDWATTAFLAYDCYTALALLEDYEVYR
ncbi:MAG: hypothetical protein Q9175_002736, partial [Cornicularia normoerica]